MGPLDPGGLEGETEVEPEGPCPPPHPQTRTRAESSHKVLAQCFMELLPAFRRQRRLVPHTPLSNKTGIEDKKPQWDEPKFSIESIRITAHPRATEPGRRPEPKST